LQSGQISGSPGWSPIQFPISSGSHTFRWEYSKDGSVSSGSDACYIDDVLLPSTPASSSLNFYSFSGINTNLPISTLIGWTQCYKDNYTSGYNLSNLTSISGPCNKSKILIGCRVTNSNTLTVAANAPRSDVFFNTGDNNSITHIANNVAWYFSTNYSMGFAPVGVYVSRYSCDTGGGNPSQDTQRLCWHTTGGNFSNGWSCGATSNTGNYERLIYHSN
jgi:hypothetical protein